LVTSPDLRRYDFRKKPPSFGDPYYVDQVRPKRRLELQSDRSKPPPFSLDLLAMAVPRACFLPTVIGATIHTTTKNFRIVFGRSPPSSQMPPFPLLPSPCLEIKIQSSCPLILFFFFRKSSGTRSSLLLIEDPFSSCHTRSYAIPSLSWNLPVNDTWSEDFRHFFSVLPLRSGWLNWTEFHS